MGSLLPVVKLGVVTLSSISVGKIVTDIIKNNVTIVTKIDKVKVATGSAVIGAMLSNHISKTTDVLIQDVIILKQHFAKHSETNEIPES